MDCIHINSIRDGLDCNPAVQVVLEQYDGPAGTSIVPYYAYVIHSIITLHIYYIYYMIAAHSNKKTRCKSVSDHIENHYNLRHTRS